MSLSIAEARFFRPDVLSQPAQQSLVFHAGNAVLNPVKVPVAEGRGDNAVERDRLILDMRQPEVAGLRAMKRVIVRGVNNRVTLNPSLVRADRPNTLALQDTTFDGLGMQVGSGTNSAHSVRRKAGLRQNADRQCPTRCYRLLQDFVI